MERYLKFPFWNALLSGAVIAGVVSAFHTQMFKPGILTLPWLIVWYVVSIMCGGGAGFVGGFLVSMVPVRLSPAIGYVVGALFGLFGYYLQVFVFLLYYFRNNPSSF
jgi:hypothetical protein